MTWFSNFVVILFDQAISLLKLFLLFKLLDTRMFFSLKHVNKVCVLLMPPHMPTTQTVAVLPFIDHSGLVESILEVDVMARFGLVGFLWLGQEFQKEYEEKKLLKKCIECLVPELIYWLN